ncbi:hypothetical protein [Saccharothrix stipae]
MSGQATTIQSAAPGEPDVGTAPAEPGTVAPPAPGEPTTRDTPKTDKDDLPGVPGSPITYDPTNLQGLHPERVRRVIEERVAAELPPHCRATLCGIKFAYSTTQDGEKCFRSASPTTVYPGGTITLFVGLTCDQPERDEPVTEEPAPEEPAPGEPEPGEPEPGEPEPEEPAGPTTTTTVPTVGGEG